MRNASLVLLALVCTVLGQTVEKTILLPDSMGGVLSPAFIEYSPRSQRFFIGGTTNRTVILDGLTLERVGYVEPDFGWGQTVYNPVNDRLYIANWGGVCVVDCATGQQVTFITGSPLAFSMTLNRTDNKLYVSNYDYVVVMDCNADTVLALVRGWSDRDVLLAWDPAHNVVYGVDRKGLLRAIDGRGDTVIATLQLADRPEEMAVNPVSHKLYLSCPIEQEVWVVDTDSLHLAAAIPVPDLPTGLLWNPTANKLYVSTTGHAPFLILVIDGTADTLLVEHQVGHSFSDGRFLLNSDSNKVYCIGWSGYTVIDGETNRITDSLKIGGALSWLIGAWNPDMNMVGIVDVFHAAFFALDCATDTAVQVHELGSRPTSALYDQITGKVWVAGGYESRTVSVVNGSSVEVDTVLFAPFNPTYLWHNPNHNKVYVHGRAHLGIFDARTPALVDSVYFPLLEPNAIYDPVQDRLLLAGAGDAGGWIATVDGVTNEFVKVDTTDQFPRMCWHPSKRMLYYTGNIPHDSLYPSRARFWAVPLDSGAEARAPIRFRWLLGPPLCDTVLNRVYFYATDRWWDSLFVYDGNTHRIIERQRFPRRPGAEMQQMLWVPQESKLYFAANETIWVYSTTESRFLGPIPFPYGTAPTQMMYCPANNRILANAKVTMVPTNTVVVIDCVRDEIIYELCIGPSPQLRNAAWDPVHNRIYIPNAGGSSLTTLLVEPGGFAVVPAGAAVPTRPQTVHSTLILLEARAEAILLDATGRKVADLLPGRNDIRHLSPGVYFVKDRDPGSLARKVVIAR